MHKSLQIPVILACSLFFGSASRTLQACPGCVPTVTETRAQIAARCDVVLLAQFAKSRAVDGDNAAYTEFEVATIGKDETKSFKVKQRVRLDQYYESEPGDLYLLQGTRSKEETLQWESPQTISETAFYYILQAPSPEIPLHKRLPYYLKFLDVSDTTISNDAYNEFALAPFEDVAALVDELPREKLRTWLKNDAKNQASTTRFGLYGIMLGLCGNDDDAKFLEGLFFNHADDYRIGMEGIVTGYLYLSGEEGLQRIREQLLADKNASTDYLYPLLRAFRIVWTYAKHRVPRQELILTVRLFLDHQRMAELAIPDLSRWQDWESAERLIKQSRSSPWNEDESFRKAVIAYMVVCSEATTEQDGETVPVPQAKMAGEFVAEIRKNEPKLYEQALVSTGLIRRPRKSNDADSP